METNVISVHVDISAEKKKVWDFYTLPQYITQWNFVSPDWCCSKAEVDFKVGGKLKVRLETRDASMSGGKGSMGFDVEGVYNEIDEYKNFVYTITDEIQVSVDFERNGDNTRVTVSFETKGGSSEQMQREGWQAILNNFKKYAESQR